MHVPGSPPPGLSGSLAALWSKPGATPAAASALTTGSPSGVGLGPSTAWNATAPVGTAKLLPANDLAEYQSRIDALKGLVGISVDTIGTTENIPIHAIRIAPFGPPTGKTMKVMVAAGMHGNEPCSVASALLLIDQLRAQPELRKNTEFTIIPNINPRAFTDKTRRTPENVDLNRTFLDPDAPVETQIVRSFLEGKKYDLALDLHSGSHKRNGFWVLHRSSLAILEAPMKRFATRWPLLSGTTKPYTMSHPGIGTSGSTSTLKDYFADNGSKWSVTVEAPGAISYDKQVFGQVDLVREIVREARHQLVPKKKRTLL